MALPLKTERAKRPDNTGGYDWAISDTDNQIIAETFEHTGYAGGSERQYIIQPAESYARLFAVAPLLFAFADLIANFTAPCGNAEDDADTLRSLISSAKTLCAKVSVSA